MLMSLKKISLMLSNGSTKNSKVKNIHFNFTKLRVAINS